MVMYDVGECPTTPHANQMFVIEPLAVNATNTSVTTDDGPETMGIAFCNVNVASQDVAEASDFECELALES